LPEYARELGFLTRYAVAERYIVRPSEALDRPKLLALVERLREWERQYAAQNFGPRLAPAIADVLHRYGTLQARRKPDISPGI